MFETPTLLVAAARGAMRLKGPARKSVWRLARRQVFFTGVEGVPLIAILAAVVGSVVVVQSVTYLPDAGQAEFMGNLLKMIEGEPVSSPQVPLSLVVRGSCGGRDS